MRASGVPSGGLRLSQMNRERVAVSLIYAAAWGLMLFSSGRYWDDWVVLDLSRAASSALSRQLGGFWQLDFMGLLSSLPGTERVGHILVFLLYLTCALVLHRLVAEIPGSDSWMRVTVPALFAVFPVNGARFAHADTPYAISLAAFMIAWLLVVVDLSRPAVWRRAVAFALFLLSMLSTASLMVFIFMVPLHLLWIRSSQLLNRDSRTRLVARYWPLLALPLVALGLRSAFLRPSGLYAGYNELGLSGALRGVLMLPVALKASLVLPAYDAFSADVLQIVGLAVALFLGLRVVLADANKSLGAGSWNAAALVLAGAVAFASGVFPYTAVGKLPQSVGWESRHQMLVPLGAALLLIGLIRLVRRALRFGFAVELVVVCALLSAYALADVKTSLAYQRDWYKQVSLMRHMESSSDMRRGGHFVFTDEAASLNAVPRTYRAYEYNGMMRRVFGDATRFGVDMSEIGSYDPIAMKKHHQYNSWEYEPDSARYLVTVTPGTRNVLKLGVLLDLWCKESFRPQRFKQDVEDVVEIDTRLEASEDF